MEARSKLRFCREARPCIPNTWSDATAAGEEGREEAAGGKIDTQCLTEEGNSNSLLRKGYNIGPQAIKCLLYRSTRGIFLA
jgi:hypothetical protein